MISFEPTEDQRLMVDSIAQFAKTTLRPRIRELEKARAVPDDVQKTALELGVGLVAVPEAVGGAGLGLLTAVLLEEELAFGDPAAGFALAGPGSLALAVTELGTEAQAREALAPFTDGTPRFGAVAWGEKKALAERAGLSTIAKRDGDTWTLDGEKAYVLNADRAEVFVVLAQVDPSKGFRGLGAFLVPKAAKGLTVAPRSTTLGLDAASFGGLTLEGVKVPEASRLAGGDDFDAALVRFFAKQSLVFAARSVGLSRAAFELTRAYVDERKSFGKPIGHFQAVAFTIADRAMDVDAARGMVWRAAAAWDARDKSDAERGDAPRVDERECLRQSAWAISFAHEAAMRCGDDGVQLHGGAGFMRDYAVEKLMRDAKQLQLCGLTAEHADQLAAAAELGVPIDPALVLPTAETQNAFI
ncbi:MAG: acyl-CoA dehydrogenase family protein [Myxococcales bacterium]|nr:acyl-CoA dehydrogenase family protein [Myxococcales bacterium]